MLTEDAAPSFSLSQWGLTNASELYLLRTEDIPGPPLPQVREDVFHPLLDCMQKLIRPCGFQPDGMLN